MKASYTTYDVVMTHRDSYQATGLGPNYVTPELMHDVRTRSIVGSVRFNTFALHTAITK
jgi:hypothetical protein